MNDKNYKKIYKSKKIKCFIKEKMTDDKKSEGLGISGFTLGVLGIILSGWIGLLVAIVGLIFCIVQQRKHKTKMAKVGIILNVIGIILSVVVLILYTAFIGPLLNENSLLA